MRRFSPDRREERGAMLVLAAASLVVIMISAALAVDLGRLAHEKRVDQRVADLAALDAARALTDSATPALQRARFSAERNGFEYDTSDWALEGNDLNVCYGWFVPSPPAVRGFVGNVLGCQVEPLGLPAGAIKAVRVKVQSPFSTAFPFVGGPDAASASAVATAAGLVPPATTTTTTPPVTSPPGSPMAGFSLGSAVATMDSTRATLLNPIIGDMIGGNLNLSVASWQGLIDSNVTLGELQGSLASAGLTVGTPTQLLSAEMTAEQLFQATLTVLNNRGGAAQATIDAFGGALGLLAQANNTTRVRLADYLKVTSGMEDSALAANLNVFQLVTAMAAVANGNHFVEVDIPNVDLPSAISGLASTGGTHIRLSVVEPPVAYYGTAPGPSPALKTAQIELEVTPTISAEVAGVATVSGPLKIRAAGGSATGQLAVINCTSSPQRIGITVSADAINGSATSNLTVALLSGLASTSVSAPVTINAAGGSYTPSFDYPAQFGPPGVHVGSTTLNPVIGNMADVNLTVGGVIPVTTTITAAQLLGVLQPITTNMDSLVIHPLLTVLGLDAGGADVTAIGPIQNCTSSTPSPTTTAPPATTTTTTTAPVPELLS